MAHRNEDLVREGFVAFGRGDMEALDRLFADSATWHSAGDNPLAGDFEGKQQIFSELRPGSRVGRQLRPGDPRRARQ